MKEIEVVIKDGKARVETRGFVGAECMDATAALQQAMGMTLQDDKTPEWHQEHVRQAPQ